jgi:predicted nucleic acid-binding protein
VDSSVVLRVLFGESDPIAGWAEDEPVSSELLRVESLRVVDRARIRQNLSDQEAARLRSAALELTDSIALVPVTSDILERAAEPFPTTLRTLDAIHLATALALRAEYPGLTLATHHGELAVAATALGFPVEGTPAT